MAQERNAHDVRKATSDGLQRIYLIIIGFAITQALKQTLTDNNGFLGPKLEDDAHWPSILFLIAFLFTVIRFAHGSVLHLTALTGQKKVAVGYACFDYSSNNVFYSCPYNNGANAIFVVIPCDNDYRLCMVDGPMFYWPHLQNGRRVANQQYPSFYCIHITTIL